MLQLRAPGEKWMSSAERAAVGKSSLGVFPEPTLQASPMHPKHFCSLRHVPFVLRQDSVHVLGFDFC